VSDVRRPTSHATWLAWPYKLHLNAAGDKKGKPGKKKQPADDATTAKAAAGPQLYDVSQDPKETTNLAAEKPELVAKLTDELTAWRASVETSLAGGDYADPTAPSTPAAKKRKK
jgi:hypothetical protein